MFSSRAKTSQNSFARALRRLRVRSSGGGFPTDGQRRAFRAGALIVLLTAIILLLRWILRLYFFGGVFFGREIPVATVKHIEVSAGEAVPRQQLKHYLGLREGAPFFDPEKGLFANDLAKRQERILKASPALLALAISRSSSNTISVVSTERTPLAKFESATSPLVIDREGVVFVRSRGTELLPIIKGYPRKALSPGLRITSHRMVDAALELLETLNAGESELRRGFLVSVDVSKIDYLYCEFTDGRHLRLRWGDDTGLRTAKGHKMLIFQLNFYVATLQNPSSRGQNEFDLTILGHNYAK